MIYTLPKIGREAIALPHFPTRHQAFIFRAYEYLPAKKIAELLGTTERKVHAAASDMGLPRHEVGDIWLKRGYITVIRRLWHILPYSQLLSALEMDEATLAEIMRNEDFLDIKLSDKPVCREVRWRELTEGERERTKKIKEVVSALDFSGVPAFDFKYSVPKIEHSGGERRRRGDFLLTNSDTVGGNENISVIGGIWDGSNTSPENQKPALFDKNGYSGTLLNFVGVRGLLLRDAVLSNSVTYYTRLCRVENFVIENISFISDSFGVNQDGLHFGGGVRHGRVKNIRALSFGQTNDDMVALNADDSTERVENLDLTRDTIEDISFENIFTECCHTVVRILSVSARIRNIRFKNIYGGFRCNAVNADGARYCKTPLFAEEDYPDGVGRISDISFENFTCYPVFSLPEGFGGTKPMKTAALNIEALMDNFRISGFKYICDGEDKKKCPALRARNLCGEKITADGEEYRLAEKSDFVGLADFSELRIDKTV